ncbi:MAG: hypothetical protein CHACPFDD_01235 [Phycisphaerae bacterium]|nr:hypothetical protein [Phycisphaerae bacterium]
MLAYVSSDSGNTVLRYRAADGSFFDQFVQTGAGQLRGASGMTFDRDGDLLVTSWRNDRVLRYSGQDGAFIETLIGPGNGGIDGPTFVALVPEPGSAASAVAAALAALRARRARPSA